MPLISTEIAVSKLNHRSITMCFRRTESLQYTPYVEECRRSLAESNDQPNDKCAAAVVKLQSILDRIHQSPWNAKSDNPGISLPVFFLTNPIEEQLKQFRQEFSPQMENNSKSKRSNTGGHSDRILIIGAYRCPPHFLLRNSGYAVPDCPFQACGRHLCT